jgi:hypothetical protein
LDPLHKELLHKISKQPKTTTKSPGPHIIILVQRWYFFLNNCDKYLKETMLRRKDFFGLTVSEVSFHGHLAPLLWAGGGAEHHDRWGMENQSCSPHGRQGRERTRE